MELYNIFLSLSNKFLSGFNSFKNRIVIFSGGLFNTFFPTSEIWYFPRSGLSIKHGISLINCVGTIDEDYRGEVCVGVVNLSNEEYTIQPDERIAQMIIARVEQAKIEVVTELSETSRGEGGFGSTGKV